MQISKVRFIDAISFEGEAAHFLPHPRNPRLSSRLNIWYEHPAFVRIDVMEDGKVDRCIHIPMTNVIQMEFVPEDGSKAPNIKKIRRTKKPS